MMAGDGRLVAAELRIKVWSDGALSVEGPIDDVHWALAVLDNARDAIKNNGRRKSGLVLPPRDVSL